MSKKTETQVEKTDEASKEPIIPDVDIQAAAEALEQTVMELVHNEQFYANLTLNMRREFTTRVPTAGVNVTDEVNLYINPYFFCNLNLKERVALLKHECLHVLNNHFVRFRDLEPQIYDESEKRSIRDRLQDMTNASTLNQAADYAINEYNRDLPHEVEIFDTNGKRMLEPAVMPDGSKNADAGKAMKGKLLFVRDLQKKHPSLLGEQNLEYYYEFLKQEQEKNKGKGQPGDQGMTLDDHSMWHESDATEDQIADKVKEVVNKAVEQTGDRAMGHLPGGVVAAIQDLNNVPRDWRQDLQRFVARAMEMLIESSRKKRNRRYGIVYPGYLINPKMQLAVITDFSGSVQDEEVSQFFAEIGRIANLGIDVTIIEHDAKVNAVYKFDPKKPIEIHGRGGTSFKEAYEKAAEIEVDGIIHFTDGECYDEGVPKPKVPVICALTGGKDRPYPYKWASKTYIEVKKKVRR